MKKLIGLIVAIAFSALAIVVVPSTNLFPQENQATASAVNAARVHNWTYSDKHIKVYNEPNGAGGMAWLYPGSTIYSVGEWTPTNSRAVESIKVPPRCRTKVDTMFATAVWIDNRSSSRTWKLYNIPLKFGSQSVIVEVHC